MSFGLFAGSGNLPLEFLISAKKKGVDVVVFALKGITDEKVESLSAKTVWIKPFKAGSFFKELRKNKINEIVILGRIGHENAFSLRMLDIKAISLLLSINDKRPETIIKKFIMELEKENVRVVSPIDFLSHLIPSSGVIAGKLTDNLVEEAKFGMEVAKRLASYDIGQTVVVKDGAVVAVEGIEGTDECIRRATNLIGKDFVVCKSARSRQDMRIDVPTVGVDTVKLIGELGGKALFFESGKTFLVDREDVVSLADYFGITIAAV